MFSAFIRDETEGIDITPENNHLHVEVSGFIIYSFFCYLIVILVFRDRSFIDRIPKTSGNVVSDFISFQNINPQQALFWDYKENVS